MEPLLNYISSDSYRSLDGTTSGLIPMMENIPAFGFWNFSHVVHPTTIYLQHGQEIRIGQHVHGIGSLTQKITDTLSQEHVLKQSVQAAKGRYLTHPNTRRKLNKRKFPKTTTM
jgi:hypothetical protein